MADSDISADSSREMPALARLGERLTGNFVQYGHLLPVLTFVNDNWRQDGLLPPDVIQTAIALTRSCCAGEQLISGKERFGDWTRLFPFEWPMLPRSAWELVDLIIQEMRLSADDLRFAYKEFAGWRTPIDAFAAQIQAAPNADLFRGATAVEAVVLAIDIVLGIAEFVGKHPPDHVIDALAGARDIKLASLDERNRFTIKCMLARDPILKGTPWEQQTVPAKNWMIGLKEGLLVYSILTQIPQGGIEYSREHGAVVDVRLATRATPALIAAEGPFAKGKFRWGSTEVKVPGLRWEMLKALWGRTSLTDNNLGNAIWGEDWDEAKLSTTANRLNNDLRKTPWRIRRHDGIARLVNAG